MLSRNRFYAAMLGLALLSSHTFGQEQQYSVQKLIQQYEAMSDKERVTFLQAIALIGFKKSDSPQPPAESMVPKSEPALLSPAEVSSPAPSVSAPIVSAAPNQTPDPTQTLPVAVIAALLESPPTTTPSPTVMSEPTTNVFFNPQSILQAQAPAVLEMAPPLPVIVSPPVALLLLDKPQTTAQSTLAESTYPHPDSEIQLAVAPAPAKLLEMPQSKPQANLSADASEPATPVIIAAAQSTSTELLNQKTEQTTVKSYANVGHKKSLRIITSRLIDYAFTGSGNPASSVFGQLLPEYQQKLNNSGVKIEIDDLLNETINFYITKLESKISDCGYKVFKNDDQAPIQVTPLQLETGIQRIVINKTLFETALIGEANAKLSSNQQELTSVQAHSSKALTQYANSAQRSSELKTALTQSVEELTNQVATKICVINLN